MSSPAVQAPAGAATTRRKVVIIGSGFGGLFAAQRLAKAEEEVARSLDLPFVRVTNDDLDRTVKELRDLIDDARARAAG